LLDHPVDYQVVPAMIEHIKIEHITLIGGQALLPRAQSFDWDPSLLWTETSSNILFGGSYFLIAATLIYLSIRLKDLPFHSMYMTFGIFMLGGSVVSFLDAWTVWNPDYWVDAVFRTTAAIGSFLGAITLPTLVPKIMASVKGARAAHEHGIKLETAFEELGCIFEKAKELDRLKTEFFANISHELRTPLTLILGPTETLLKKKELGPAEKKNLTTIQKNARLLLKHVNDLLDVSKLEAGKMGPQIHSQDLSYRMRLVASHFEVLAAEQNIKLIIDVPDKLVAEFDPNMIDRVALNLLSNAFKFVPAGGIVRFTICERNKNAILEVADSGHGVALKDRVRVFERFTQIETDSESNRSGTGLGLSIAKEFVNLHKGEISVAEAPEGGALFTVKIPVRSPVKVLSEMSDVVEEAPMIPTLDELKNWNEKIEASHPSANLHAPTVLVVEDNHDLNHFLVSGLSEHYNVRSVLSGREALDIMAAQPPDLILSDVMMPHMSGDKLVAEIRKNPDWDSIPVVMLTAKADDQFRIDLLKRGVQDYILKPFSTDEVIVRVGNLLAVKRAKELLQKELHSQVEDLEILANQVSSQRKELQESFEKMRVARDEALKAGKAKDNFLGLVSHEVRTPLTALQLQLEMFQRLMGDTIEEKQGQMLKKISQSSKRSLDLIDSLLEYTRFQSGHVTSIPEKFDLEPVVSESVDVFVLEAQKKGVELKFKGLRDHVSGMINDSRLIRMVVQNLIGNAVKYTDSGEVRIELQNHEDKFYVVVEDTGPGIPDSFQEKVFEPFEQVAPLERKHKPGLGLGLCIARQAASAVGGSIQLESKPGHGCRFVFQIPSETAPV
jgi:signal transduction histidine kinase